MNNIEVAAQESVVSLNARFANHAASTSSDADGVYVTQCPEDGDGLPCVMVTPDGQMRAEDGRRPCDVQTAPFTSADALVEFGIKHAVFN